MFDCLVFSDWQFRSRFHLIGSESSINEYVKLAVKMTKKIKEAYICMT